MNIKLIASLLVVIVVVVVVAYIIMQPKGIIPATNPPKTSTQINQQIDSAITQEMDKTLANVNQADVEQILLS